MKKKFVYLMLVFGMLFGGITAVNAQSKALLKDVKKTVKEKKKGGWTLLAGTSTMEYALTKYRTYMEEDEENRIALTGVSTGKNNKIAREAAIHNGITSYAKRAKAQVVGKVKSIMSSDESSTSQEELDKFAAAYEVGVNTRIGGLVKQHFVLVRETDSGKKEFEVFMSIDEARAKKAREEALLAAQRKANLGELSEMVEEFIGEPVSAEE